MLTDNLVLHSYAVLDVSAKAGFGFWLLYKHNTAGVIELGGEGA